MLRHSLQRRDGLWAAFEVGVVCPRQNGKNAILEARELAGLFLFGERLLIHTAHLADTAKEAFRRLENLCQENSWLDKQVAHYWHTNGHEEIELKNGNRIRFRTRTKGGGRGFSGDWVCFDEAMEFSEAAQQATMFVVSARPDPQIWYTGSAVDQLIHDDGRVFASVRERGVKGGDSSLAFFEWSLPYESPEQVPHDVARDPDEWAKANPALDIRIRRDYVGNEHRAFAGNPRGFAVERLGVGDWPDLSDVATIISLDRWQELADEKSTILDPVCFAVDVAPDRSWATVAAAGKRGDGLYGVEVVQRRRGTGWVKPWLLERVERHQPVGVVYDGGGPARSLSAAIDEACEAVAGLEATPVSSQEYAEAYGVFFDAVEQGTVRHRGHPELAAAIRGAARRPLGDAWAWARKTSSVDISPLVAVTLALWGAATIRPDEHVEPAFLFG